MASTVFLRAYLDRDRDGALPALRTVVRRAPSSVLILNAAGWPESCILNSDTAIACLRRAVRLDPMGHVGACSRLGWGIDEIFVGSFGAAAAILEQAMAENGPTGGVLQALLVIYWHQGRMAEARGLVPQIQELIPRMSARWEVSEMALLAPGPRRIVLEAFLAACLPE